LPRNSIFQRGAGRVRRTTRFGARYATAPMRALPDFVILGVQRGGTTSLYSWLASHPDVAPALVKEPHYFDYRYDRGSWWYRANFPVRRRGRFTGEASPGLLMHPLAPGRAARDLPPHTKFIALLRDPTQRAISQYWLWQKMGGWEDEPLERAMELEEERLAPYEESFLRGERSNEHIAHGYLARGDYAPQLRRWFDAVGRDRVLVLASEQLFADPAASAEVLDWLGLRPFDVPYPVKHGAPRLEKASPELVAWMDERVAPRKAELVDLLSRDPWADVPGYTGGSDVEAPPAEDAADPARRPAGG
jgi:LPS sulfotransferase NodH